MDSRRVRAAMITCETSNGVRPAARIVPAYGTVMLPLESTICSGSVTKLPGRAPASLGRKSPPASASKIVTLTTSPMPRVILLGGRRENTFDAFAPHRILAFAFAGVWYLPLHSFIERASGTGVRNPRATAAAKRIVLILISIGLLTARPHVDELRDRRLRAQLMAPLPSGTGRLNPNHLTTAPSHACARSVLYPLEECDGTRELCGPLPNSTITASHPDGCAGSTVTPAPNFYSIRIGV